MECLNPYIIFDYQKPFGQQEVHLPCGRCAVCRAKRQSDWVFRLKQEGFSSSSVTFITLTYNADNIKKHNGINVLCYRDVQLFFKRLRTQLSRGGYKDLKIRYFCTCEYGPLHNRPHYHLIVFNLPPDFRRHKTIESLWSLGFVDVQVSNARKDVAQFAAYVGKYAAYGSMYDSRFSCKDRQFQPRSVMSNGIGKSWLTPSRVKQYHSRLQTYIRDNGYTIRLPRYYFDRIFCDEESRQVIRDRAQAYFNARLERDWEHAMAINPVDPGSVYISLRKAVTDVFVENFNRKLYLSKFKSIRKCQHSPTLVFH